MKARLNTPNKEIPTIQSQKGITMISILFIGGFLVFLSIMGMKVFPAYSEFLSVKTVLRDLGKESLSSMTKKEIKDSFDTRAGSSYVTVISSADLNIEKNEEGETVVTAEYQVVKPAFANLSFLLDFKASSNNK